MKHFIFNRNTLKALILKRGMSMEYGHGPYFTMNQKAQLLPERERVVIFRKHEQKLNACKSHQREWKSQLTKRSKVLTNNFEKITDIRKWISQCKRFRVFFVLFFFQQQSACRYTRTKSESRIYLGLIQMWWRNKSHLVPI